MHHDPIADFLTRIRNAQKERHRYVDVPLNKQSENIAKVLQEEGFIKDVMSNKEKKIIRLLLRYAGRSKPVVNGLKRVSKPSVRRYVGYQNIPRILGGMGIAILSTSQGVLEGEKAREQKLGGELLCYIW